MDIAPKLFIFWSRARESFSSETQDLRHIQNLAKLTVAAFPYEWCGVLCTQNRVNLYTCYLLSAVIIIQDYPTNASVAAGGDDTATHVVQVPYVRVVKRRTTANKKERRRTQSINNAYADLRDCIPNVPPDTKLSKIKTLRLATSYINYLVKALESDDPAGSFTAELGSGCVAAAVNRRSTNSSIHINDCSSSSTGEISPNSDAVSEDINKTTTTMTTTRKAKGRTGWPQHVWALELEQDQAGCM